MLVSMFLLCSCQDRPSRYEVVKSTGSCFFMLDKLDGHLYRTCFGEERRHEWERFARSPDEHFADYSVGKRETEWFDFQKYLKESDKPLKSPPPHVSPS